MRKIYFLPKIAALLCIFFSISSYSASTFTAEQGFTMHPRGNVSGELIGGGATTRTSNCIASYESYVGFTEKRSSFCQYLYAMQGAVVGITGATNTRLGNSGGSQCILTPYFGIHSTKTPSGGPGGAPYGYYPSWAWQKNDGPYIYDTSSQITLKGACSSLLVGVNVPNVTMTIPYIDNITILRTDFRGGFSARSYNHAQVLGPGELVTAFFGFIACPTPGELTSNCTISYLSSTGGDSDNGTVVVPVSCSLSGDTELDYGTVNLNNWQGASTSAMLLIQCSDSANVKIEVPNGSDVTVGPFRTSVQVDGAYSKTHSIGNSMKSLPITGKLTSSNSAVKAGSYSGSVVIIATVL